MNFDGYNVNEEYNVQNDYNKLYVYNNDLLSSLFIWNSDGKKMNV